MAAPARPVDVLSDLTNVATTAPADGQALVWSTAEGKWVPDNVSSTVIINQNQVADLPLALTGKADDTSVVHVTGTETVAGTKTFSTPIVGDISVASTGTSTVRRSMANRSSDEFNVKNYGATGNGTTDDIVAIWNAVSDLSANGGGKLIFPQATYKINQWHPSGSTGNTRYMLSFGSFSFAKGLVIRGEGSTITTPLYVNDVSNPDSGSAMAIMWFLQGQLNNPVVENLTCLNTHPVIAGETCALYMGGGSNNVIKYPRVNGNIFKNFSRTIQLSGVSNTLISRNFFGWDLGRDSGSSTYANSNGAIWAFCNNNGTCESTSVDNNQFDGCTQRFISNSATSPLAVDNFIIGNSLGWSVTDNMISRHGVEGIFLGNRLLPGNSPSTTLQADYHAASGTMTVASSPTPSVIFGSPTSNDPTFLYTIYNGIPTIFVIVAVSGTTLTVGGVTRGTVDQDLPSGTWVIPWRPYPNLISGNTIDSRPVKGQISGGFRTYSIRCDETQANITDNTITDASRGILCYGADGRYPTGTRFCDLNITDNHIGMIGAGGELSSYGVFLASIDRFKVHANRFTWQKYAPIDSNNIQAILAASCNDGEITGNTIQSIEKTGGNTLTGIQLSTVSNIYINGNTCKNIDTYISVDSSTVRVGEDTLINVSKRVNGSCLGTTIGVQRLDWQPPTGVTGWYTLLPLSTILRGRMQISHDAGTYDNRRTALDYDFDWMPFDSGGHINQRKVARYNNGVVTKGRVTPYGVGGPHSGRHDIWIDSATAPIPMNLRMETEVPGLFLLDTPAFTSDSTASYELSFGDGLRGTSPPTCGSTGPTLGSGATTLLPNDVQKGVIAVNAAGGSATITLPNANSLQAWQSYMMVRLDTVEANTVTITPNAGQLINGLASVALAPRCFIEFMTNGGTIWATRSQPLRPGLDYDLPLKDGGVRTTDYTALANQIVRTDTTSNAVNVTLPSAPAVGTRMVVKMITQGGSNNTTLTCGGSDVFNVLGGSTTRTLSSASQSVVLQYISGVWVTVADDQTLGSLDARYPQLSGSYADPSWITALSAAKITGTIVATNGVVTTGSYADPSWLTALAASKITGIVPDANLPFWYPSYYTNGTSTLQEWNGDYGNVQGGSAHAAGTIYLAKIFTRKAFTGKGGAFMVQVNGGSLANVYMGLYDASGNQLAVTANLAATLASSTGMFTQPFASTASLTAGTPYYVAFLCGTGSLTLARAGAGQTFPATAPIFPTAANLRFAINGTGASVLPSTLTIASNASASSLPFWCGLYSTP